MNLCYRYSLTCVFIFLSKNVVTYYIKRHKSIPITIEHQKHQRRVKNLLHNLLITEVNFFFLIHGIFLVSDMLLNHHVNEFICTKRYN